MTSDKKKAILTLMKDFFTKNIALKIIALLFAMLLWGYVLTDQKPLRVVSIKEVTTSFDGEAELLAQGLCIRGDRAEILKEVEVDVRAQITNVSYLSPTSISAVVSLKNISEPRTYVLPVQATVSSSLGVVQSVTPSTLTVEVDLLRTRTVPVTTKFTDEVPEGYWADTDALSATTKLDVSGAKTDVSRVTRAECTVSLAGRTSTIYSTFDVVLYDAEGNVVDADIVVGTIPSATVRLPIYSMKEVPVDVESSLIGTDHLAANHEITTAIATPATLRIVGEQSALDAVTSIALEPINVGGLNGATTVEAEAVVPEGVRLIDTDPVSVHLDIRESMLQQTFEQLPVTVRNTPETLTATLTVGTVDLTVDGRYSIVSLLKRSDIEVFVDVAGLTAGAYTLPIQLFVGDAEKTVELTTKLSVETAEVTLAEVVPEP